jgi:hypothetical protein
MNRPFAIPYLAVNQLIIDSKRVMNPNARLDVDPIVLFQADMNWRQCSSNRDNTRRLERIASAHRHAVAELSALSGESRAAALANPAVTAKATPSSKFFHAGREARWR